METTLLAAALSNVVRLRALVAASEESAQVQRATVAAVLPKTQRRLLELRRLLASALIEASRQARDAGDSVQALELAREYATQDHLASSLELRESAGR